MIQLTELLLSWKSLRGKGTPPVGTSVSCLSRRDTEGLPSVYREHPWGLRGDSSPPPLHVRPCTAIGTVGPSEGL